MNAVVINLYQQLNIFIEIIHESKTKIWNIYNISDFISFKFSFNILYYSRKKQTDFCLEYNTIVHPIHFIFISFWKVLNWNNTQSRWRIRKKRVLPSKIKYDSSKFRTMYYDKRETQNINQISSTAQWKYFAHINIL